MSPKSKPSSQTADPGGAPPVRPAPLPSAEKHITLQSIADLADVSRATVSLALRNHPSLPKDTRQRIQGMAEQLGYRPNPLVSALMRSHRQARAIQPKHLTLAFVANFSRDEPWQSYLSPDLITGAAARAKQQGYGLEEYWLNDLGLASQRLSQVLYQRGVLGVILAPLPQAHGCLNLEWFHFSAVAIGYTLMQPALHRVSTHRFRAMLLAIRRLRSLGYQRPGLALDIDQDARANHEWTAAFVWEQHQAKPARPTELFLVPQQDWNESNFARWFRRNRPDAVLGYDPRIPSWLKRLGCHVPDDAGFAHLWNPDQSGRYAGLYHHPPALGAAAMDLVVAMIERNERGIPDHPQSILLEPVWVDGATVRAKF